MEGHRGRPREVGISGSGNRGKGTRSERFDSGTKVNSEIGECSTKENDDNSSSFSEIDERDAAEIQCCLDEEQALLTGEKKEPSADNGQNPPPAQKARARTDVEKIREHEEEISQLKKHLAEFSVKESQIRNEKYALEKRISYMRLAFDQQQQDLILAASKAISYRQDIMEENVRLTYALQAAQQERLTFVTSLTPLLAEYSLQPPVADAQSIVSNVKVLFRHLQEQLLVTEGKLKESEYQLAPWRSDINSSNFAQSPVNLNEIKKGLELVPQQMYSDRQIPSSDSKTAMVEDISGLPQVDWRI